MKPANWDNLRDKALKRIRNKALRGLLTTADDAANCVEDGMNVGMSGFTPAGYPKAVPLAIAQKVRSGKTLKINVFTGASVGGEIDGELTRAGAIKRRYPYQTDEDLRRAINSGKVSYCDIHLSKFPQDMRYGFYGDLDLAIVEAVAITEDGNIIPSTSVGNTPTFISLAHRIIVEVNLSQPESLEGIHDIYIPEDPPARKPIPITDVRDRIGVPYIPTDYDRIVAIVPTEMPDKGRPLALPDEASNVMASHLMRFLDQEVAMGRLPANLLPIQSGVGSVANAVLAGLSTWHVSGLMVYSEVIQDAVLDLIDVGIVECASGTSLSLSETGRQRLLKNIDRYRSKIILRPQEITNHPEVIRRLGCIAMNTALEVDIYGHVNSTHVLGTSMMNGIGGSGDFARNAYLSIFATRSTAKGGSISSIVPMVSHVDHPDHDVHVILTEMGLADIRGLSPRERARVIISNCASPEYVPALFNYFRRAELDYGGFTPHILEEALSWHTLYRDCKDMRGDRVSKGAGAGVMGAGLSEVSGPGQVAG